MGNMGIGDIPACPGGITTDLSRWPIVVMTPPSRAMTDQEFKDYLDWVERHITRRGETYTIINDVRRVPAPSAAQRRFIAERMDRLRPFSARYCAGSVMVFESTLMRGIMTAISWMAKPDHPVKVCATVEDALVWCEVQLGRALHQRAVEDRRGQVGRDW